MSGIVVSFVLKFDDITPLSPCRLLPILTYAMAAKVRFSTFHSNQQALPPEITLNILRNAFADTALSPMGGGVSSRNAHHPIASVSRGLRVLYLGLLSMVETKELPLNCYRIGEVLAFDDLKTMAAFFTDGPGRDPMFFPRIRCLIVSYLDNCTVPWWVGSNTYAYEAFELLYSYWGDMSVERLRIHFYGAEAITSVDDPGIWSLLKIRGLAHLELISERRSISPQVRTCLKARTRCKNLFPWRPLGLENPGPTEWPTRVKYRDGVPTWRAEFEWLDSRYKFLQDRETIAKRCEKQRQQRTRWPVLSRRKRKRRAEGSVLRTAVRH
jgi:hypothetical protein